MKVRKISNKSAERIVKCLSVGLIGAIIVVSFISYNIARMEAKYRPLDGMGFSSQYVVEEYEYDDAMCVRIQKRVGEREIPLDSASYKLVRETIAKGQVVTGTLVADTPSDGRVVYKLINKFVRK